MQVGKDTTLAQAVTYRFRSSGLGADLYDVVLLFGCRRKLFHCDGAAHLGVTMVAWNASMSTHIRVCAKNCIDWVTGPQVASPQATNLLFLYLRCPIHLDNEVIHTQALVALSRGDGGLGACMGEHQE